MNSLSPPPLLCLTAVSRRFKTGDALISVLDNISLSIKAGEMVAIVGPSGSGKSTLMNILGCLDTPSSGHYQVDGQDVEQLNSDQRAGLRRERFGFIFQRYHLIPSLSVRENIEIPARYAHQSRQLRLDHARRLLDRLGMQGYEDRNVRRLSGGQQQRVSIARALINGGEVILADEPTGALDSRSGSEVMQLLQSLHQQGHTVIIITHDAKVADYAERIIHLADGKIVSDLPNDGDSDNKITEKSPQQFVTTSHYCANNRGWRTRWHEYQDAFGSAGRSLAAHRLRSCLTLLGIVIGIVSVVSLNAAGAGARQYVLDTLSSLGGNVVTLYPGKGYGDDQAASIHSLRDRDLSVLAQQRWITAATPNVSTNLRIRRQRTDINATVNGVSAEFMAIGNMNLLQGRSLLPRDITQQSSVVVVGESLKDKLFPRGSNPLGEIILVGTLPAKIVGVARSGSLSGGNTLNLWLPWSTATSRLLGQDWFDSIAVSLPESVSAETAKSTINRMLTRLHGRQDFYMLDSAAFVNSVEKTSFALSLFLSLIALISLLVGGIGVMNIMLVSVSERTRETGIRMAVGARRWDIQRQFLTEAVLLCLSGALVGVTLSLVLGISLSWLIHPWQLIFSLPAILTAVGCAVLVGVISGWLPAWQAAKLDPAEALTRE
ncbi:ABC transporter permease [Rouxiella sp. WC2420]|uniref:ABC transporter permease n=1 Tax=Rouxiella sp. WC2420 TaxID=3234145 RepID=A0AB39VJZ1_9GAMM